MPADPQPFRFTGHERDVNGTVAATNCVPFATVDGELTGTQVRTGCYELDAGPDVTVATGADVTFRAGETIVARGEFAVEAGATFAAVIDAELGGVAVGLDYMHARYCSAELGRFLSTDPIDSGIPANPQQWNQYTYARNNPLRLLDPDGRTPKPFYWKNYRVRFDTAHGGLHLDVDVKAGGRYRLLTRISLKKRNYGEPVPHGGPARPIPGKLKKQLIKRGILSAGAVFLAGFFDAAPAGAGEPFAFLTSPSGYGFSEEEVLSAAEAVLGLTDAAQLDRLRIEDFKALADYIEGERSAQKRGDEREDPFAGTGFCDASGECH